jgi:hypothetical protein
VILMAHTNVAVLRVMLAMVLTAKTSTNVMDLTNATPMLFVSIPVLKKIKLVTIANVKMVTSIHTEMAEYVMTSTSVSAVITAVMLTPHVQTSQVDTNVLVMMVILVMVTAVTT